MGSRGQGDRDHRAGVGWGVGWRGDSVGSGGDGMEAGRTATHGGRGGGADVVKGGWLRAVAEEGRRHH
jgi:hypothetical protein